MLHTIISGIPKLAEDTDKKVKEFSTVSYEEISSENELILALSNCDIFWFRLNRSLRTDFIH